MSISTAPAPPRGRSARGGGDLLDGLRAVTGFDIHRAVTNDLFDERGIRAVAGDRVSIDEMDTSKS